jgi:hypothetical protein
MLKACVLGESLEFIFASQDLPFLKFSVKLRKYQALSLILTFDAI